MKELQNKQRKKRMLYSIPSIIILGMVAFFLAKGAIGVVLKERESRERLRDLEAKAEALVIREAELQRDIAKLQTREGVIEEIKEKFSVTEEGEYVAIIVDERNKATTTEERSKAQKLKDWWRNLWSK